MIFFLSSIRTFSKDKTANHKEYCFDKVFGPNATQEQVYNEAARSIVDKVLDGFNGALLVYGRTASGKTYTMEGVLGNPIKQGIIPRIVHDIFDRIAQPSGDTCCGVVVSYFENHFETVRDLLVPGKTLSVNWRSDNTYEVENATKVTVTSPEEMLDVLERAQSNRKVGVTNLNAHSSRSHAVLVITVSHNISGEDREGQLCLVDLAGSENTKEAGTDGVESGAINKSLLALKKVIEALAEGKPKIVIPFKDTILTK